jgi:glycosyltransferase involved in cell wall biosynthesis
MKISILLPYKEDYSSHYAGAVSIFINDTLKLSKYKKNITVYGNTKFKKKLFKNYVNIPLKRKLIQSLSKDYVLNFLKEEEKAKSTLIEIHNRPLYFKYLQNIQYPKKILYFHNDPLEMQGSKKLSERLNLINELDKIIFNSNWSKQRFIHGFDKADRISTKLIVIKQSTNKVRINLRSKEKLITFVGKLNKSKGYDLFGQAVINILNKHKDWKSVVIGDEPRENIDFKHKRLKLLGHIQHTKVLKYLQRTSISVVCSRWEEPFGRTSLEAASRGCAVIISNRGGLPETITDGITIKNLNVKNIEKKIEKLINNKEYRIKLQFNSLKNFYLTNKFASKKIDYYRNLFILKNNSIPKTGNLNILHVTNFNERHYGRLFYNTGRRINNGLVKLNHNVLTISDRDIVSNNRRFTDINGSKKLNQIFIKNVVTFKPDLIILGHADLINNNSLFFIKKNFPCIKMCQWFLDRMDSEWIKNKTRFKEKVNLLDANFCTTDPISLKLYDKSIYYIPNPVDSAIDNLKVFNNKFAHNDLFFAMSHGVHRGILKKGKYDYREVFLRQLIKKAPYLKFNFYGFNNNQPIWGEDFKKELGTSKMALNLSQGKSLKYYSSDRIAQLMGNGILTFVDEKIKLRNFFKKDELLVYKDLDDLIKKINQLRKNDKKRIKIAKNGWKRYHKDYNSTIIADFIISKTMNIKKNFSWENTN